MTELKNRGDEDVLIAVVDGLKGFPEAITAVFPQAQVQTCIVHLIRNSLSFVSYKDRKAVAAALKEVYRATDAEAGAAALEAFAAGSWGIRYPAIVLTWPRHWSEVIPFFAFPDDIRRIVYTTNAIEALNAKLRRAVRTRGHFPNDEAAMKLLFLVLHLTERDWKMPPKEWGLSAPLTSRRGIGPKARWSELNSRSCLNNASRSPEPRQNGQSMPTARNS